MNNLSNKKFCYKVFHAKYNTDNSRVRNIFVERIKNQMLNHMDELDTPTLEIFTVEDVKKIYSKHRGLRVYPTYGGYGIGKRNKDNTNPTGGWKIGDLAIIANNYVAWQNFYNSEYDYALIMEDDIILNDNFIELLNKYMLELPEDWEVFSMFTKAEEFDRYSKKHYDIGQDNVCKSYNIGSLAAYVINKKFVKKMMDKMQYYIQVPADLYLFNSNYYNCYNLKPGVEMGCFLAPLESTYQYSEYYDFFEFFENLYHSSDRG
jgi:hypothetical protein